MKILLLTTGLIVLQYALSVSSKCTDYRNDCRYYKRRRQCNQRWMRTYCQKTCGWCYACYDSQSARTNCRQWKSRGYCLKGNYYYPYMRKNCPRTCGFCNVVTTKAPPPTTPLTTKAPSPTTPLTTTRAPVTSKPCANSAKYDKKCGKWIHYCRKPTKTSPNKYYKFMKHHCPKTCDLCGTTQQPQCGIANVAKKDQAVFRRVVGGKTAQPFKWIWQVALYYYDEFSCGGSLISPQYVITAAHCIRNRDMEGFDVRFGDHQRDKKEAGEIERTVLQMKYHESYDYATLDNDIAILKLNGSVPLSPVQIGTVCLPGQNENVAPATQCIITGWGRKIGGGSSANVLQEAELPIISNKKCGERNIKKDGTSKITGNMICAGHEFNSKKSGCQGDSGGPLVCKNQNNRWVLQGVVSWGSQYCDAAHHYTVFARTSKYINWIKNNMKN